MQVRYTVTLYGSEMITCIVKHRYSYYLNVIKNGEGKLYLIYLIGYAIQKTRIPVKFRRSIFIKDTLTYWK